MVLGIDVGSLYTKAVLFDGEIRDRLVLRTSFKPKQAIQRVRDHFHGYDRIAATGYGRELVAGSSLTITEITSFMHGTRFLQPTARTIIDIGGQDSKVIRLSGDRVDRFVMNDRCAAGTGHFVEKIAAALDLSMEEFGRLALRSESPEPIDSLCVVMAETEILSLVGDGKDLADIVYGVCDSLVRRVIGLGSQIGVQEPLFFCGGGALNLGLVRAMRRHFPDVVVPDDPQFIGAIGAAVAARRG